LEFRNHLDIRFTAGTQLWKSKDQPSHVIYAYIAGTIGDDYTGIRTYARWSSTAGKVNQCGQFASFVDRSRAARFPAVEK
jgi:hypothetical protein